MSLKINPTNLASRKIWLSHTSAVTIYHKINISNIMGENRVKNVRSFFPPTSLRQRRFLLLKSISYSLTMKYKRRTERR